MECRYKNALSVTRIGKNQFRNKFSAPLGGNAIADKVFALSQGQVALNLAAYAQANAQVNGIHTNVLPSTYSIVKNNAQLTSAYERFYGPSSRINCEHCQSNLSPAAYLVDLLGFLEKASNASGVSGRTLLSVRLPEIEKIDVSYINTDTLMPYIDLVLEVLENALAPQPNFAPQTTKSAEELAATPENINIAAYEKLKTLNYPWNLPFDLEVEHSRVFLAQSGVARHDLLRYLRQYDGSQALAEASAEYLGVTTKQASLITVPLHGTAAKNLALAKLWGFNQFADLLGANRIESVMTRMNLTLVELKSLLSSAFVNPLQVDCFNVNGTVQNLTAEMLDRAHRLARIFHLTDYAIESLDKMLSIASQGAALVPELAAIRFLEKEADVSLDDIKDAWALPVSERATRFASLFGVPDDDAYKLGEISKLPWTTP
ncbi:MAG: hypothetical protein IPI14_11360 [Polaromonas sp.]|nr:hypothetical protein [Polaromonas sp.]